MHRPADILSFWFSPQAKPHWFARSAAFDAEVQKNFFATYEAARDGKLADWEKEPKGRLALIIVLDQFPRNMFRDSPQAFATDAQALGLTKQALARQEQVMLNAEERNFLYLPLMHSESLSDQDQCVKLCRGLGGATLDFANQHRDIIARFGRFPHRNAVLGRPSTPEETQFLETHSGF